MTKFTNSQINAIADLLQDGESQWDDLFKEDCERFITLENSKRSGDLEYELGKIEGSTEHQEWKECLKPHLNIIYEGKNLWRIFSRIEAEEYLFTATAWRAELNFLQDLVNKLRDKKNAVDVISYDFQKNAILVGLGDDQAVIDIPFDTYQSYLCRTIFRDEKTRSRNWRPSEIIVEDEWDYSNINPDDVTEGQAVHAGYEVRRRIKKESGIDDLLIVGKKFIRLNPAYDYRDTQS